MNCRPGGSRAVCQALGPVTSASLDTKAVFGRRDKPHLKHVLGNLGERLLSGDLLLELGLDRGGSGVLGSAHKVVLAWERKASEEWQGRDNGVRTRRAWEGDGS